VIKIADFVGGASPGLKNIQTLAPGEQDCFYETHDFSGDERTVAFFRQPEERTTHTGWISTRWILPAENHSADSYRRRLDEHAHYSPDGGKIAWMSSTGLDIDYGRRKAKVRLGTSTSRRSCGSWMPTLQPQAIDAFQHAGHAENIQGARCIVSDSTWAPDGKSICACVAWVKGRGHGVRLVRIELH